jgi:hypothetical protein
MMATPDSATEDSLKPEYGRVRRVTASSVARPPLRAQIPDGRRVPWDGTTGKLVNLPGSRSDVQTGTQHNTESSLSGKVLTMAQRTIVQLTDDLDGNPAPDG